MNPGYQPQAPKRMPRGLRWTLWGLAIYAALNLTLLLGVRKYAADNGGGEVMQAKAKLKTLEAMLASRRLFLGHYPTEKEGLDSIMTHGPISDMNDAARERVKDPWHRRFQYRNPGIHNKDGYDLYSFGPDGIEDTEDDIKNW